MSTTHNVEHVNNMLLDLKKQHQERIEYLQSKIASMQEEINHLQRYYVKFLNKEYDC